MSRWIAHFALLAALVGATLVGAARAQGPDISAEVLLQDITTLASDAFEGREPTTEGERQTLAYLIRQFSQAGLKPGYHGEWLQPTPLIAATVVNAPSLKISGPDGEQALHYRKDQVIWTKRAAPRVVASDRELVFVGYGVTAPQLGWQDYAGQTMKGKIALILINDPDFEAGAGPFGGAAMSYYGRWTYKFEEAARQGAVGALIIHETAPASYPWAVVESSWTGPQYAARRGADAPTPVGLEGWITEPAARGLFRRAGLDFDALKAQAQRPGFKPRALGLRLSADLTSEIAETLSYNVIALLPGARRPQETVLYSAHWDHIGRCPAVNGDGICNGAQDNASGTAGLLALARAHAAAGPAERSLAFIAFTAEEQGLLGSAHYAADPAFPLQQTAALVNMDGLSTLGRARDVTLVGAGQSELDAMLQEAAAMQGRVVSPDANPERGSFYRSDQFSLAKVGVPSLYIRPGLDLREGGSARGAALEADYVANRYHKPADQVLPGWDLSGAVEDLQLLYAVGRRLSENASWPAWSAQSEFRTARPGQTPQPAAPEAAGAAP